MFLILLICMFNLITQKNNERICIIFLPEVCFVLSIKFLDYNLDAGSALQSNHKDCI